MFNSESFFCVVGKSIAAAGKWAAWAAGGAPVFSMAGLTHATTRKLAKEKLLR